MDYKDNGLTPEAKADKRGRFDALPSPAVSSMEARSIPRGGGNYVARVFQWLQSNGVIGYYKNNEKGWNYIAFNRKSVKDLIHHGAGADKVAVLEVVPELINNGIFLETNAKNDYGLDSHIFAAKATIDGVPYAISYAIRQDNNGRRYYDHSLTKMEALDSLNTSTNMDVHRTRASTSPAAVHPVGKEPLSNILKKHLRY